jgi:hypothetical protein
VVGDTPNNGMHPTRDTTAFIYIQLVGGRVMPGVRCSLLARLGVEIVALIFPGKTECSICGVVLNEGDDMVATTHFIADQNDPLWRFSDSAMHRSCFLGWVQRQAFVRKYNETIGTITWGNGTYHRMEDDGHISVLKRGA